MRSFPDLARVEYNDSGAAQFPVWRTLIMRMPCRIESATGGQATGGGEAISGLQQAAQNEYAVECRYSAAVRIGGNHRLVILVGPYAGMLLEVVTTGYARESGHVTRVRLTCRELERRLAS